MKSAVLPALMSAALVFVFSSAQPAHVAAQPVPGAVIELAEPVQARSGEQALRPDEIERTAFRLKFDPLATPLQPGQRILLPTPIGASELNVTRAESYVAGTFSVQARGADGALATLTFANGRLTGVMHGSGGALIHFRHDAAADLSYSATIEHTALDHLKCAVDEQMGVSGLPGGGLRLDPGARGAASGFAKTADGEGLAPNAISTPTVSSMAAMTEHMVTVDVLIVYTQAAKTWAETCSGFGCTGAGTIEAYAAQSIALSQTAVDNSNLPMRFRLVGISPITYDEINDGVGSDIRLDRLTASPSYNPWGASTAMDEVHTLRATAGADLVAGLFKVDDTGGIAWRIGNPAGSPELGFSLNRIQQVATTYTVAHEMGHNMGLDHSRNQDPSNAAGPFGGVFPYSVGYRWASGASGYTTVMGYDEGYSEIPLFSTPLVNWDGTPAGTVDGAFGPADAVTSLNQMKYAVGTYLTTRVDPPAASLPTDPVQVVLRKTDQAYTHNLSITNSGASDLMWHAEVDRGNALAKSVQQSAPVKMPGLELPTIDPIRFDAADAASSQGALSSAQWIPAPVYETMAAGGSLLNDGFEGVSTGSKNVSNGWRANSTSTPFSISNANPATGSQHMRLSTSSSASWVRSPYLGPQANGSFELAFDLYAQSSGTPARLDLYVTDGTTGDLSAGLVLFNGIIYTLTAQGDFMSDGTPLATNAYRTFRIVYDPVGNVISYFYGGSKIVDRPYTFGDAPDYFEFILLDGASGGTVYDIDNVSVTRSGVTSWFDVGTYAGTVAAGETGQIELDFNTNGLTAGSYASNLRIYTNDPNNPSFTVPLQFTIDTAPATRSATISTAGPRLLSAPYSGAYLADLLDPLWTQGAVGSDSPDHPTANVYTYNGTDWVPVTNLATQTLTAGQGFMVRVYEDNDLNGSPDLPVDLTFTGIMNENRITLPASYGSDQSAGSAGSGWNLVGNPYESGLTAQSLSLGDPSGENPDFASTLYVYDPASQSWKTWNRAANTGTLQDGRIAPFQGFFVQSTKAGASIAFEVGMRTESDARLYRSTDGGSGAAPSIRFELGTLDGSMRDEAIVAFSPEGLPGAGSEDAYKLLPLESAGRVGLWLQDRERTEGGSGTGSQPERPLEISVLPLQASETPSLSLDLLAARMAPELDRNGRQTGRLTLQEDSVELRWEPVNLDGLNARVELVDRNTGATHDLSEAGSTAFATRTAGALDAAGSRLVPPLDGSRFELRVSYEAVGTSTGSDGQTLPAAFALEQNTPNPFNPSTRITFSLARPQPIRLEVFSVIGERVAVLEQGVFAAGAHSVMFDASRLSSGVYLYRLTTPEFTKTRSMVLMK